MRFLFNLHTQTLKIPQGENSYLVLTEEFRTLGGIGFVLDSDSESWIIFKISSQKVKVIYKTISPEGSAVYYQRELFRPPGEIIEVEFSEWDQNKNYVQIKIPSKNLRESKKRSGWVFKL